MKYSFEKLEVWNDSRELTKMVYNITKGFPDDEIRNQIEKVSDKINALIKYFKSIPRKVVTI